MLTGEVSGAAKGDWIRVQRKRGDRWTGAFWTTASASGGRFRATLPRPGTYRVTWHGINGPAVIAR